MNGKIGILSTGSAIRAICLAVNTTSLVSITVGYKASTQGQTNAGRIDELNLQYRVGTSGVFTTVSGTNYSNNATSTISSGTAASNTSTFSATLPQACEGQANVQLRWIYRDVSGTGSRPSFSIDDISVTGTAAPTPTITLSSPSQITAANVSQGTVNQPISNFQAAVTTSSATLNTLTFVTGGTYTIADITGFNCITTLRLIHSAVQLKLAQRK